MATNPTKISFARAVTARGLTGLAIARDAQDYGGMAVKFDNAGGVKLLATVDLPAAPVTSLDLTKIPGYAALEVGNHSVALAEISKNGSVGAYSTPVNFTVDLVPDAPTNLELS